MKALVWKSLLVAALATGILVLYNVILDPFSVIRKDYDNMLVCPNERIAKTEHLIANPTKYDSFLFGSSVVNMLPVADLEGITGHRWYNLTYVSGMPGDHVHILKLMLERGVTVKRVLLGVDILAFRESSFMAGGKRIIHYPETILDRLNAYYEFLTMGFDSDLFFEIRFDGIQTKYDLLGTGQYYMYQKDRLLKEHPERHKVKFTAPPARNCSKRFIQTIQELRRFKELCDDRGIELRLFVNPMNNNWYRCENIDFMNLCRAAMASLGPFWDFSGGSTVTADDFNFYDITHYRPAIGAMMVARLFNQPTDAPADFGRLVTADSLGAHQAWALSNYAGIGGKPCGICHSHMGIDESTLDILGNATILLPTNPRP